MSELSLFILRKESMKKRFLFWHKTKTFFFFWEIIKPVCREQWALLDGVLQGKLKKKKTFNKAVNTPGEITLMKKLTDV